MKLKIAAAASLLLVAGLAALLIASSRATFAGDRVKTSDSYMLDIRQMNGADAHTLALSAGDALQIEFEAGKGSLHMEIKAPDGATIYAGNGREATAFEINISQDGAYAVAVEARHAEGRIRIRVKKAAK